MVAVNYEVVVTREGDKWLADVPEVSGAHTYAKSLEGLERSVREVVELMDDARAPGSEIEIDFVFAKADGPVHLAFLAGQERRELAARDQALQDRTRTLVTELIEQGVSGRDAARILDITNGRVSQLANS